MVEKPKKGEAYLYEPVKIALWDVFSRTALYCYLEVTNEGLSNKLQRSLDDFALFYIKIGYKDIKNALPCLILNRYLNEVNESVEIRKMKETAESLIEESWDLIEEIANY